MTELAIVVLTFNERLNILELVFRLEKVLNGLRWEVVFATSRIATRLSRLIVTAKLSDPNSSFFMIRHEPFAVHFLILRTAHRAMAIKFAVSQSIATLVAMASITWGQK